MSVSFSETDPRTITSITDVSETGAFVTTEVLYPVGAMIQVTVVVRPERPTVLSARARVVRLSVDPSGMGVEFVELDAEMLALVRALVELERSGEPQKTRRRRRRTWQE